MLPHCLLLNFFFFFNDTATTEIYTLSLHDALPILLYMIPVLGFLVWCAIIPFGMGAAALAAFGGLRRRSEEHTSELQSLAYLVCRLLLEKKKNTIYIT